jgi:hypothetical protein
MNARSLRTIAPLFVTLLTLTACGVVQTPQAAPQASPQASRQASPQASQTPSAPQAEFLFAVTESNPFPSQPNTVAIVGLDGIARAKAKFQPRTVPGIPDTYTPQQGVAQVVGSGVYYIDGAGTVRVLRVGSQPRIVARFPLQPAQEDVWFAVSPDGSRILAGILTFPALGPTPSGSPYPSLVGPSKFDLETAPAGGQSKTLVHLEVPQCCNFPTPIFPVGWITAGPVAMVPQYVISQNAWPGGSLYVIDAAGRKTTLVGGSNCDSASITPSGLIPCISGQVVTVRDQSGKVVWVTHVDSFSAASLFVSPDGQAISDGNQVERHVGGMVALPVRASGPPSAFRTEGWFDNHTIVGRIVIDDVNEGDLAWIDINHPTVVHDLGFKGDFGETLG